MPCHFPVRSIFKTDYGAVDGKWIQLYSGTVEKRKGWYVVKAWRVDVYEAWFQDYDEEGRTAWFYDFWKERIPWTRAVVKRSVILKAIAARRARVYAQASAILACTSPLIQSLCRHLPPECGGRVLQFLVYIDDIDPGILPLIAEAGSLQISPLSASPRWLWMKARRMAARRQRAASHWRHAVLNANSHLAIEHAEADNPWSVLV